jgi:hypothetical protein
VPYSNSPLNPRARKVGKPSKLVLPCGATPETAARLATDQARRDGVVEFEFNDRMITVDDTDYIKDVVRRVNEALGL